MSMKVAVVQAPPVLLDRAATIERGRGAALAPLARRHRPLCAPRPLRIAGRSLRAPGGGVPRPSM